MALYIFTLELIKKIIYNDNRVRLMNEIILEDVDGNKTKATFLFTHFDYNFSKNYIVYLIDNDLLASSYEEVDGKYIIDNDLSSAEYDMIDKVIESKMGDKNE